MPFARAGRRPKPNAKEAPGAVILRSLERHAFSERSRYGNRLLFERYIAPPKGQSFPPSTAGVDREGRRRVEPRLRTLGAAFLRPARWCLGFLDSAAGLLCIPLIRGAKSPAMPSRPL